MGRAATAETTNAVRLSNSPGLALHERLAEAIQDSITAGKFKPGERLPTHRTLAKEFNVAIGTVTRAIDTLSRQGVVRGEIGRGTFVTQPQRSGASIPTVDLSLNALPSIIPHDVFDKALQRALVKALELPAGGYADPTGTPTQRAVLATWLARDRVPLGGDDLITVVGGQHGISLAFADLRQVCSAIATEPATFTGAMAAARAYGIDLVPVPIDDEGMVPDALDKILRKGEVKAIYTTPVGQSPLGFETGRKRREAIAEVCSRRGAFIVEDDVYGVFGTPEIPTYKALAPDITYYVNSASKALTSLIRIGVLAPPKDRRGAVIERLRAEVWSAAPLSIVAACELIEAGQDVVVRKKMREEAEVRLGLVRKALGSAVPATARPGPHVWLPMPLSAAEQLARRAIERGVRLTPPTAPLLDPTSVSGVRLCTLAPRQRSALAAALSQLADIVAEPDDFVV